MATIGSIDHILKTAFKDVYNEKEKRANGILAREMEIQRQLRLEKERIAEQERLKVEAEEAAKEQKKAKDKKGSQEKKESSKKVNQINAHAEPVQVIEPQVQVDDQEAKFIDTYKDYKSRFDQLQLEDVLKEKHQNRLQLIEDELVKKQAAVNVLLKYLEEQRHIAKEEEVLEEEDLKKQGIIVGQHIPALKSHLIINRHHIQSYGNISNNLLIASDLMEQNHVNMLRRSGNLPITELAEQRMTSRSLKKTQAMQRSMSVKMHHS